VERVKYVPQGVELIDGDVTDCGSLVRAMKQVNPNYIFHLAAHSFVGSSWQSPAVVMQTNTIGTLNVLEAMLRFAPTARMYNAASSEMFGNSSSCYDESSPFDPVSPYAVSKVSAFQLCRVYRWSHDLFVVSGIAFNHGSPRRGIQFVERKITNAAVEIATRGHGTLVLGNMGASRDWLHAKDVMEAAYLMLKSETQRDYIIASGVSHTVQEVCEIAFRAVGLNWEDHVRCDVDLYRPHDVGHLRGDSSLIRSELGWRSHYSFQTMIKEMIASEYAV